MLILRVMMFVDTHCHISDPAFQCDEDQYISNAIAAGVNVMVQADIDSSERDAIQALVRRHPKELRVMIGLYPGSVREDWQAEIDKMLKSMDAWLAEGRTFAAMGEIGLDYHEGKEYAQLQKDALSWQLEYAAAHGLSVNIHLRDAMGDFIDVVKAHKSLGIKGNMHCYSGSYESFAELSRLGDWSIGIGGVVTFKHAQIAEVVKKIPLDRIVLETDAPYLSPVPFRGTRNESSHIPLIAAKIAEIKGVSIEEVAEATTRNAYKLMNI